MSNPTTNQIKNKSVISGLTLTEALNTLFTTQGEGLGDMLKIVYDNNNNGKVDVAELAEAVPWAGVTSKPATFPPQAHNHVISDVTNLQTSLDAKQATLVSGTNIKTVNGNSLLGSGDLVISGGGGGSGDVIGPASSVNNSIAVFDGTTGKLIKDGGALISSLATTAQVSAKQDTLVSGTNIKTVNGTSLLGSGNVSISGGGGLTLVELSTTSQTAANGSNYAFTNAAATTLTAPASPTVGMRFGWMICNNRTDNVINWNGAKHENISDATMTINGPNEVGEAEYINATFGWKVK